MTDKPLIIITGPTATGKTRLAVKACKSLNGEVVSADSRQIYQGMDLGTGKDLDEYGNVPYHLIDIAPAGYKYNLFEYLRDAKQAIDDIRSRGRLPIVCGGTGLYVESLAKGIELPAVPENKDLRSMLKDKTLGELTQILASMKTLHNTTDVDTVKRAIRAIEIETYYAEHPQDAVVAKGRKEAPENTVIIVVDIDREARRKRISDRLHTRLENGMVDEVKTLLDNGISSDDLIYYGLEYKFLTLYLIGQMSYDEMVSKLEIAIHQFAKRQMTWFRGMERRGFILHHIPYDISEDDFINYLKNIIGC